MPVSIEQALSHYQSGDLPRAEQLCREILKVQPADARAWDVLGLIAHRCKQDEAAADCLRRALQLQPTNPEYHNHFAEINRTMGRVDVAVKAASEALRLAPNFVPAHNNLGLARQERRELADAEQSFRQAILLQPGYKRAWHNLGNVLHEQQRFPEAVQSFQQALQIDPNYVEALNSLGVVHHQQRQFVEACNVLNNAIQLRPRYAPAHMNLGNVLSATKRIDAAEQSYRRALQLRPDYVEALIGLGESLRRMNRNREAAGCLERAAQLQPENVSAHLALGNLYFALQRSEEAAAELRRAQELDPDSNDALGTYLRVQAEICDWEGWPESFEKLRQQIATALSDGEPTPLSPSQAHAFALSPAEQLAIGRSTSERLVEDSAQLRTELQFSHVPRTREKIKLGYLSCDFRYHAVAHLVLGLFALHDRNRFEVYAYSYGPDDQSDYRRRIEQDCDHFIDGMALSTREFAQRIYNDGIDILVDMVGYTGNGRPEILAVKPAPVQMHFLGFPGTMGAEFIDYLVTDSVITPPDHDEFFSEALVRMPGCYQINDNQQPIAERAFTRKECGLPEKGFVFCSFNGNYKIEPVIFDVWMRILQAVPNSVLWLLESSSRSKANLRREAAARGVEPERLVFAGKMNKAEHLARHRLAGLFLDTPICNAHTTASDALWAGLPLLTCPGETYTSRVAASLLTTIGLPQLVAKNLDEYEQQAVELAQKPHKLSALRRKLKKKRDSSPLFDTPRYVKNLEQAYQTIWETYTSGQPPAQITVVEEDG